MAAENGESTFDVVVVGGGPGGYVAAIRAAQLGLDVACVEAEKLGGVCLNIGCIPTKALLESAARIRSLDDAASFGMELEVKGTDLGAAVERSRKVSGRLNKGVGHLFKKNGVTHVEGYGRLAGGGAVEVETGEGGRTLRADAVIVATGSRPRDIPVLEIDGERVWSSDHALFREEAPGRLAIVGAGYIGMEFADVYDAFGSEVVLIEALDRILPLEDEEISKVVAKSYGDRGIGMLTSARLEGTEITDDGVRLTVKEDDGEERVIEADYVLSSVGRVPNVEDVGLEEAGVELDDDGFIRVDAAMRTSAEGVYAVGDCAGPPLLAHKGSHEGVVAAEEIAGEEGHGGVDYDNIPSCVYCHPEVASVGLTEAEAREAGYDVEVGKFPWVGNGRALTAGETEGFVKIVRDTRYSELLGAHLVGPHVTELISEFVVGRHLETTVEEMDRAIHPHPTLSEAIGEGALAALGRPIHI